MKDKKIVILGAGESGAGAAVLAKKLAEYTHVFVSDAGNIKAEYKDILNQNKIDWEENKHSQEEILSAQEVVKSPGIPDNAPLIKELKKRNIPVISEIEFAGRHTNAKSICITGSNGKTTTTSLIYHVLKNSDKKVRIAGNIGSSFALQVAEELDLPKEERAEFYVIELSSFQLDGMFEFKPYISVLLNITPDHLDRYENDFQKYIDSKFRIIQNQKSGDFFVYCTDDEIVVSELKKRLESKSKEEQPNLLPFSIKKEVEQGAFATEKNIKIIYKNEELAMLINDLTIKGKHNIYNAMAAGITSTILEIRKKFIKDNICDFKGIEHRLELVGVKNGVRFINDSKATNINSTWYALDSVDAPVIWLVGGVDKGNDYTELESLAAEKVKQVICIGKEKAKIHKSFKGIVVDAESMEDAVAKAYKLAGENDTVLLSPACASFDRFKNYMDRGEKFKNAVYSL